MSHLLIFCEGTTDQIFIGHCLSTFWDLPLKKEVNKKDKVITSLKIGDSCEIIGIGGCSKLKDPIYLNRLRDNTEEGGTNIVVFDADFSIEGEGEKQGNGNNGYNSAKQKLEDIRSNHEVAFDYYLWHNNASDGEIEHLLYQLIPQEKKIVMDCIETHHKCLVSTNIPEIKHADLKTRLSYYIYTMNYKSEPYLRDYGIKELWDLDCEKSEDLLKFRTFLNKYAPEDRLCILNQIERSEIAG